MPASGPVKERGHKLAITVEWSVRSKGAQAYISYRDTE